MRRALIAAAVLVSFASAAPASAAPLTHCRFDRALVPGAGPVRNLAIRQAASRVDNYLSRCQVASFAAGRATESGSTSFTVGGARWYIGRFRCTFSIRPYRPDELIEHWHCVHTGRYPTRVSFDSFA